MSRRGPRPGRVSGAGVTPLPTPGTGSPAPRLRQWLGPRLSAAGLGGPGPAGGGVWGFVSGAISLSRSPQRGTRMTVTLLIVVASYTYFLTYLIVCLCDYSTPSLYPTLVCPLLPRSPAPLRSSDALCDVCLKKSMKSRLVTGDTSKLKVEW